MTVREGLDRNNPHFYSEFINKSLASVAPTRYYQCASNHTIVSSIDPHPRLLTLNETSNSRCRLLSVQETLRLRPTIR